MISTSITEPVRFVAPWRQGEPGAPTYFVRAASVRERSQFEAEMTGLRAGRVFDFETKAALREGVTTLMASYPEYDRVMALLAEDDEAVLSTEDRALLTSVVDGVAQHFAPYRDLMAQLARRNELVPTEAARRFIVGIENSDVELKRGFDGMLTEATLAAIEPLELIMVGRLAFTLMYGGGEASIRNFPQPGASENAETNLNSDVPQADGSSGKKRGRKTPA